MRNTDAADGLLLHANSSDSSSQSAARQAATAAVNEAESCCCYSFPNTITTFQADCAAANHGQYHRAWERATAESQVRRVCPAQAALQGDIGTR